MNKNIFKILFFVVMTNGFLNLDSMNLKKSEDNSEENFDKNNSDENKPKELIGKFNTNHFYTNIRELVIFKPNDFDKFLISGSFGFITIHKILPGKDRKGVELKQIANFRINDFNSDRYINNLLITKDKDKKNLLISASSCNIFIFDLDKIIKNKKTLNEKDLFESKIHNWEKDIENNTKKITTFKIASMLVIDKYLIASNKGESNYNLNTNSVEIFDLNRSFKDQNFGKKVENKFDFKVNDAVYALATNKKQTILFISVNRSDNDNIEVWNTAEIKNGINNIKLANKLETKIKENKQVFITKMIVSEPFLIAGGQSEAPNSYHFSCSYYIFIFKINNINNIQLINIIDQDEKQNKFSDASFYFKMCENALFKISSYDLKLYDKNFKFKKDLRKFDIDNTPSDLKKTIEIDENDGILYCTDFYFSDQNDRSMIIVYDISEFTKKESKDLIYFFYNLKRSSDKEAFKIKNFRKVTFPETINYITQKAQKSDHNLFKTDLKIYFK